MMMKLALLLLSLLSRSLEALSPTVSHGGGLPVVPAGGFGLFNPETAGLVTGSSLGERLEQGSGYTYLAPKRGSAPQPTDLLDCQDWLESFDQLPLNFAKPQNPAEATLLGRTRIISDDAPGDIQHVILKLPEGFHYVEGQSISVIPPGVTEKGKPHKPRLYSIASTRYGDVLDGNTVSLCVRRAEYHDPITGQVDPSKKGVCSNYLCDSTAGETVKVAGPIGKTMLLPESPDADVIMVATGTGIAPFRGFLHRLFMETTVARHLFQGQAWLVLGVPTTGGLLYPQEFDAMKRNAAPGQLTIDYAISREMQNRDGGKLYVQHLLEEKADELWEKLDKGAHIYFCGLKGMMPGILESLEKVASQRGVDWTTKLKELQANGQWHVEVY